MVSNEQNVYNLGVSHSKHMIIMSKIFWGGVVIGENYINSIEHKDLQALEISRYYGNKIRSMIKM